MIRPDPPPHHAEKSAQSYFRKVHRTYQELLEQASIVDVYSRIKREIGPRLEGVVLDVGSGGVPNFESDDTRTIVSLDYVVESLRSAGRTNVLNVGGDILALPLRTNSVDHIIVQYMIHYLTDPPFEKPGHKIHAALAESARVLRKDGKIFFVDSMVPRALECVQRAAYGFSYYLLRWLRKPTVFFFSVSRFIGFLETHGLVSERIQVVDWGQMSGASQTLFPRLRIPLRYFPVKCVVITAVKA
jgi:ubiquinone/menaquinone biosynthesis C-methylase UbiE